MRFETRFDRWIVVLVIVAGVGGGIVVPLIQFMRYGPPDPTTWLMFLPPAIFLVVLACLLPQYYEVRENGLFLRQGWRKNLIPYASLNQVRPHSNFLSAPVFSTHRILLVADAGKQFLIAVAEEERFLAELSKRCPHLEHRDSGLGSRFSAPSIG